MYDILHKSNQRSIPMLKQLLKNNDGFTIVEALAALIAMAVGAFFIFLIVTIIHFICKFW